MRKFTFRLETLLQIRELAKEKAIVNYGKAIAKREKCEEKRSLEMSNLTLLKNQIKQNRILGFYAHQQSPFSLSLQSLKDKITLLNKQVDDARTAEDVKRKIFNEADSRYKSLLKLKSNQKSEHFSSESRKEDFELEDIINSRFLYNRFTQ
ncbi:hypothetical protein N9N13_04825 [Opitutales bacterium]|nr:hypothetical protein [Opitutales bacterium]